MNSYALEHHIWEQYRLMMNGTKRVAGYVWRHTFARLGEDWIFLALLGVIMAVLNFAMDRGIAVCNNGEFKYLTMNLGSYYIYYIR